MAGFPLFIMENVISSIDVICGANNEEVDSHETISYTKITDKHMKTARLLSFTQVQTTDETAEIAHHRDYGKSP